MAGRPREFDREKALESALEAFWARGFEATSIAQLTTAMGIAPPSLYAAFGDKRGLFDQAVAQYCHRLETAMTVALAEPDVRVAVESLMVEAVDFYADTSHPQGCFVMSEPSLSAERARVQDLLVGRLARAVDERQLPDDVEPVELADFIAVVLGGLSARSRDGATHAELRRSVDRAMAAWPEPPSARP